MIDNNYGQVIKLINKVTEKNMAGIRQTIISKHSSDTFATKEEARDKLHSDMGITDELLAERITDESKLIRSFQLLEDKTGYGSIREYVDEEAFKSWRQHELMNNRQYRIDALKAGWTINISFELV